MNQNQHEPKRRQALVRAPTRHAPHVTERDLQILATIYDFGGVLTTIQIALLFFAPNLLLRFLEWGILRTVAESWLTRYSAAYLHQRLEFLKWATKIARIRAANGAAKTEQKTIDWLRAMQQTENNTFAELMTAIDEMERVSAIKYLERLVEQQVALPKAFCLRPRVASEFESSACKQRLRYLLDLGLLEPEQQATKLSSGRAQTCWFLSRQGRNLVAEMQKVSSKDIDWKPVGSYGMLHLSHRLAVNNFRLAVQIACQLRGYTLRRWIDDNQLKRMLSAEKIILQRLIREGEEAQQRTVSEQHALKIPDGFFWLDFGDGKQRHCWFEFDNQTLTIDYTNVSHKDFAHKIRTMSAFYRQGRYKELFPEAGDSMWYLVVTSGGQTRLTNLKTTTENVIGMRSKALDRYWFTTTASIQTWQDYFYNSVFEPIWQRAGQDRMWRLDEDI